MLFYTGLLFLVIAVSLDGFGVGVTYGMRQIRVPLFALCIIMCCSGIVVLLSMTIGNMLHALISPGIAAMIGGIILIMLGCFSLINVICSRKKDSNIEYHDSDARKIKQLKTVLTTPDEADLDSSGVISAGEALLLGIALALDAFGAGLAAAIIGYSPIMTAVLVAFMSGLFVFCGMRLGMALAKNTHMQKMTFIPPVLLILLGVYNLF